MCEGSYFELDPRCHWKPVKFIEQWSGTAQSIRLQNDAGQHVLLALELSGQGLRHAIHARVGLNDVIFIEISCIRKRKLIKTLKFH